MTAAEVRVELAAAASLVDGISVAPYFKEGKAGTGYVEFLRTEYPPVHGVLGGEDYWGVVVVLPPDLAAAQQFVDQYRGLLREQLRKVMVLTQVRPEVIPLPDNPSIRSMVIEGHRAAEE